MRKPVMSGIGAGVEVTMYLDLCVSLISLIFN